MKERGVLWTVVDGVLLISVGGMLVTVLLQIATRLAGNSVPWTEELTRNLFVLTIFMGLAVGFRRVEHARMTFLLRYFPSTLQKMQPHFYVAGGLLFFGVLAYRGVILSLQQYRSGEISPALGIPMFLVTAPIPIGAVLAIIAILQSVYGDKVTREKLLQSDEEGIVDAEMEEHSAEVMNDL